ncbi:MAG: type II secretion system GspH family protein [Muribaculaceae bacterium]|nr:type II secretion system GspH family protein [Muribaculaceae bacterium]
MTIKQALSVVYIYPCHSEGEARKNPADSLKSWIASHPLAMTTLLQNYCHPEEAEQSHERSESRTRVGKTLSLDASVSGGVYGEAQEAEGSHNIMRFFAPLRMTENLVPNSGVGVETPTNLTQSSLSHCERVEFQLEHVRKLEIRERVKKAAFTLAETLITLGIIGIVAAMTIPNLMAHYRQKSFVIQWRKSFSTFAGAIRSMQESDEVLSGTHTNQGELEYELATIISRHMKISKICHEGKGVEEGCFPERYKIYYNDNVAYASSMDKLGGGSTCMSLLNGVLICLDANIVFFDVNGYGRPNTIGSDIYAAVMDLDNYVLRPAIGNRRNYGPVDGITLQPTAGNGTCDKTTNDRGWGCSKYYLHNMP